MRSSGWKAIMRSKLKSALDNHVNHVCPVFAACWSVYNGPYLCGDARADDLNTGYYNEAVTKLMTSDHHCETSDAAREYLATMQGEQRE